MSPPPKERNGGRWTDELDRLQRLARMRDWKSLPLTIGLAAAIVVAGFFVVRETWQGRDQLDALMTKEIGAHDVSWKAHEHLRARLDDLAERLELLARQLQRGKR